MSDPAEVIGLFHAAEAGSLDAGGAAASHPDRALLQPRLNKPTAPPSLPSRINPPPHAPQPRHSDPQIFGAAAPSSTLHVAQTPVSSTVR